MQIETIALPGVEDVKPTNDSEPEDVEEPEAASKCDEYFIDTSEDEAGENELEYEGLEDEDNVDEEQLSESDVGEIEGDADDGWDDLYGF